MKRGVKVCIDPSFAEKEEGNIEAEDEVVENDFEDSNEYSPVEEGEHLLEQIDEFAKEVLREYLLARKFKETLKVFEKECSSTIGTFSTTTLKAPGSSDPKQVLKEHLRMKGVISRNSERGEPYSLFTILEHMIEDRIAGTPLRGKHSNLRFDTSVTFNDGSNNNSSSGDNFDNSRSSNASFSFKGTSSSSAADQRSKSETVPYELDNTGSTVTIGNKIQLSSKPIKHKDSYVKTSLSDLRRGLLINDIRELRLKEAVPLGVGASSRVYRVLHVPSGVHIAVKKIPIHEPELRKEILREINTLYMMTRNPTAAAAAGSSTTSSQSSSKHSSPSQEDLGKVSSSSSASRTSSADAYCGARYIVQFHGGFFEEGVGNVLIALECMSGSLEDAIEEVKFIGEEILRAITFQVIHALFYLHKVCHIHHRDIKASNLLLGKDGRVKVSDFGVSSDAKMQTMAPALTFVGTVIYMSPERLRGDKYAPNADLWSLGLVLMHAATGQHPFKGFDMFKILNCASPPKLPSKFSADFQSFVVDCLTMDPKERPTTDDMRRHKWISNMTKERSEIVVLDWAEPILAQLEIKRANRKTSADAPLNFPSSSFAELDSAIKF